MTNLCNQETPSSIAATNPGTNAHAPEHLQSVRMTTIIHANKSLQIHIMAQCVHVARLPHLKDGEKVFNISLVRLELTWFESSGSKKPAQQSQDVLHNDICRLQQQHFLPTCNNIQTSSNSLISTCLHQTTNLRIVSSSWHNASVDRIAVV